MPTAIINRSFEGRYSPCRQGTFFARRGLRRYGLASLFRGRRCLPIPLITPLSARCWPERLVPWDELRTAAAVGEGLLIPMGFELVGRLAHSGLSGEMRALSGPGGAVTAILWAHNDVHHARNAVVALINTDLQRKHDLPVSFDPLLSAGAAFGRPAAAEGGDPSSTLALRQGRRT